MKNDKKSSGTEKTHCHGVFGYTESLTLMIRRHLTLLNELENLDHGPPDDLQPSGSKSWRHRKETGGERIELLEKVTIYLDWADASNPLFISTSTRRRQLRCLLFRVEVEIKIFLILMTWHLNCSTSSCQIQSQMRRSNNRDQFRTAVGIDCPNWNKPRGDEARLLECIQVRKLLNCHVAIRRAPPYALTSWWVRKEDESFASHKLELSANCIESSCIVRSCSIITV